MRAVVAVLAILFAALWSGGAEADPYAWCAEYSGGGLGGSSNCYFTTLDQCKATIAGVGGTCSPNPFYTGPAVNQQQQQPQQPGWNQPRQRPWWLPQQPGY
jgi:hypothetical protein